ncbi:MAG: glycosyltransferase family 2 protein [Pseudomonadota bacterium]
MTQVSVIIPAYNREETILRALASAQSQTHEDLDIIVIDDASTDRTAAIVLDQDDSRVRLLRHTENQFAAAARNTGMRAATGDYIAFLDSDDEWHPRKLETQLATLSGRDTSWAAVYCGANLYKDGTTAPEISIPDREGDVLREYVCGDFVIWTPTFLFRRDILQRTGLMDPALQRAEDRDFFFRILTHFKLAAVPEPLVNIFLETDKPVSHVALDSRQRLLKKHEPLLRKLGTTTRRKAYARQWALQAEQFAIDGQRRSGLAYAIRSVAMWPFLPPRRYAAMAYKLMLGRVRKR